MSEQVDEVLDIAEYKFPKESNYQIEFSFDWSTGHAAYTSDALIASKLNLRYGERDNKKKKLVIKETTQLLEDYPAMKVGDIQHLYFQENDPPPFYKPRANDYIGKAKGVRQILFERGLLTADGHLVDPKQPSRRYKPGSKKNDERDLLSKCADFAAARPAIAEMIDSRGHICDFTPKFHCEVVPIEYIWGWSKRIVRQQCDFSFAGLLRNIPLSFSYRCLPRKLIWGYFRLTRRYLKAYAKGDDICQATRRVKKYRSHRAVLQSMIEGCNVRNLPWSIKKKKT